MGAADDRTVLVAASVESGVVLDLVRTLGSVPGWRSRVVSAMPSEAWARGRASGSASSLLTRLRGLAFPLRLLGSRPLVDADVVIATTNPFWLPTLLTLAHRRRPVVTLVYDVYPDALTARWRLPRLLVRTIEWFVGVGLRRSAVTVFLGERIRATLVDRYGLTRPSVVIPPGIDPDRLRGGLDDGRSVGAGPGPTAGLRPGQVVISYVGNAGSMHDVVTIGAAMREVARRHPELVRLVVSARGDRAAELIGAVRDLQNATALPYLDGPTWSAVTNRTDIAVVGLDARAGEVSVPSKVQAALAAGSALFVVAPSRSDLAELIRESAAGVVVEPGDVDGATTALERLVRDARFRAECRAAALAAFESLTPERLAMRWAEVLRDCADAGP